MYLIHVMVVLAGCWILALLAVEMLKSIDAGDVAAICGLLAAIGFLAWR
jgi:hypothetical protein